MVAAAAAARDDDVDDVHADVPVDGRVAVPVEEVADPFGFPAPAVARVVAAAVVVAAAAVVVAAADSADSSA